MQCKYNYYLGRLVSDRYGEVVVLQRWSLRQVRLYFVCFMLLKTLTANAETGNCVTAKRNFSYQGLFQKIRTCMRFNQKRARKSSKRAQLLIFTPHSSKFKAFRTLHPPKRHVFLEFLVKNKAYHFSKRARYAGTSCNKWLKKALVTFTNTKKCMID